MPARTLAALAATALATSVSVVGLAAAPGRGQAGFAEDHLHL